MSIILTNEHVQSAPIVRWVCLREVTGAWGESSVSIRGVLRTLASETRTIVQHDKQEGRPSRLILDKALLVCRKPRHQEDDDVCQYDA